MGHNTEMYERGNKPDSVLVFTTLQEELRQF